MFRLTLSLLLGTILLLTANPVHACSCVKIWTPTELFEVSDLVVAGRVQSIDPHPNGWELIVAFETHAVWKGPVEPAYLLITASDGAMCGYTFELGEEYFVYADDAGEGNWSTHLCGRNAPLFWADEDIAELGPPRVVPVDEPSFGMIKSRY